MIRPVRPRRGRIDQAGPRTTFSKAARQCNDHEPANTVLSGRPWLVRPGPDGGGPVTGHEPDLTVIAARWLVDQQLMGVVLLDRNGIITDCYGGLVDWVETGRRYSDCLPVLTGFEDALEAVAKRQSAPLFLPGIRASRTADGEQRLFSVHCFATGDKAGVALVFQDASNFGHLERSILRRRDDLAPAEHRLTQAQEIAKAANQASSLFLANISHELRTPLNVIIGNAEILRDWDPSTLPAEDLHTFAEDILDNGTFLLDHINDLLDLAKAEIGGIDLVEEEIDIDLVVDGAVAAARKLPKAGALTILHQPAAMLPRLIGDPQRLRQIVLNLLGDAVTVTPDGRTVTVRTFVAVDGALTIEILSDDDGSGITEASLDGVPQPFGKADIPAENRARSGIGPGLPLAKTLIELHDGTLTLDNTPGKGTRLTLRFPPKRTQAVA